MSGLELAAARTCPASEFSYTGGFSSAVVLFPKLSKLLNQENALSAPCSPWHPRGALHGQPHGKLHGQPHGKLHGTLRGQPHGTLRGQPGHAGRSGTGGASGTGGMPRTGLTRHF